MSMWRKAISKTPIAMALVAVMALACSACAADSAPPWRGAPGTTFQEWNFSSNANPAAPENVANAFGLPSATIDYNPPYGTGWTDTMDIVYGPFQGWWDVARGSITLNIINHPSIPIVSMKDFQVQVSYWKDINQAPSVIVAPTASLVSKDTSLLQPGPILGGWYLDVWTFHSDPNHNSETITVLGHQTSGSQMDKVSVDTRYVAMPETVGQAISLPVDTVCSLSGSVVSRSFDTYFYIEDPSRAAGIRVNCALGQAPAAEGTIPQVNGVFRTIDGERVIDQATVMAGGSGNVEPLIMTGRALGRGLSPQGLLATVCGKARVTAPGDSSFTMNDGSGVPFRVELHGSSAPADASHVVVTGVWGADSGGPVLRMGPGDSVIQLD